MTVASVVEGMSGVSSVEGLSSSGVMATSGTHGGARKTTQSQFCAEAAAANSGSSTQRPLLSRTFSRIATDSGLSSSRRTRTCSAVARNNEAGTHVDEKVRPVKFLCGVVVCCLSSYQHRSPTNTVGGAFREDSASASSIPTVYGPHVGEP